MIDKIIIMLYTMYLFFVPESLTLGFFSYSKILLIITFLILLYNVLINKDKTIYMVKKYKRALIPLLCFSVIILFSNIIGLFCGGTFLLTNFYEILRIILYVGVFFVYLLYFDKYNSYIIKLLLSFVFVNCLLGITQFYNFFNMNEIYVKFFAPTQYETLVNGYAYPRIIGFTSNPNVYGFLLSIVSIFILKLIVNNKKNIYLYVMFLFVKINLYMTMSRSSFICALVGEFLFIFFYFLKNKKFRQMLIGCLSVILLEFSLLVVLPNNLTWRVKELVNFDTLTSWQKRQEHNKQFIEELLNNNQKPEVNEDKNDSSNEVEEKPEVNESKDYSSVYKVINFVIGNGSDKLSSSEYYDNEWFLLFHRYGLLGVASIIYIFLSFVIVSRKVNNAKYALATSLVIISMIYMYPAAIMHSYKLFPILMLLLAYTCNDDAKNDNNKNVLVLATYFPPYGGIGVMRVTKFAKYLKLKGWNPIIVTSSTSYCLNYDQSLLKDIDDLTIYRLDMGNKCNNIGKSFYRYLKKNIGKIIEKENPMCAFITGGPFYLFKIGALLNNKYSVPYVLDFRDPWTMQVKNDKSIKTRLITIRDTINEFFSIFYCSFAITVNQTLTNQYKRKYPIFKKKMYVIGNGYDKDDFEKIKEKKFDEFTILYSGKFEVSAGFRDPTLFFRALCNVNKKKNKVKFVHIGNVEQRVVEIAKKEKAFKYCKFMGYQSYNETISYCKGADLLLIISGKEKSEQTGKVYDYIGCNNNILAITDTQNELYKICINLSNCFIAEPNNEKAIEQVILDSMKIEKNVIKQSNLQYDRSYLTDSLIQIFDQIKRNE